MSDSEGRQAQITGATRLYAIIGDPIEQVRSPEVLSPRLAAAGLNAVLVPVHVRTHLFDETVRGLKAIGNLDGIIITVPYKARIMGFIDKVLPMAAKGGAANAMRREPDGTWLGEMFDGAGLVRGMRDSGLPPEGRRVMQVGAGGVGSAIAIALADAGVTALTLFDVEFSKAQSLAERVAVADPGCKVRAGPVDIPGHDTLINATPIGMASGDGIPMPVDGLTPDVVCIDVIHKPETTPFLAHAAALGCRTYNGYLMLFGQVEELTGFFVSGAKK